MEVRISGAAVDKVGGRICDSPVPEPVGGGSEGHTLRADVEREDLTNDDPGDWAPGGSEEGDVDTHEGDEDFLAGEIAVGEGDTADGDDVFTEAHTDGTDEEKPSTTETFNTPDTREGHSDVDDVGGDRNEEGVGDTRALEERRTEVEDEVDTGELLPALERHTGEHTERDLVGLARAEAVDVR